MNLLALVLSGILNTQIQTTKLEANGTNNLVLVDSGDSVNNHTFVLGDSLQQIAEREERERVRREEEKGQSYTGQGQAKKLYEDTTNNCAIWAKKQTGINKTIGAGGRAGINSQTPQVGSIGVERGRFPHAVVVVEINGDTITINESNYIKNWITERVLKRSDFLGFII